MRNARRPAAAAVAIALGAALVSVGASMPVAAEPAGCDGAVTHSIGEVQGSGTATPVAGQQVTVGGVVVGDFQETDQLRGFFLQDPAGDGSAATSDGIFVFYAGEPAVVLGDTVQVSGVAQEFNGLTQLTAVTALVACGTAALPAAAELDLPANDAAREALEGMLVTLGEPVTATETFTLARFGELVVSVDGRLFQPTNGGSPDDAAEQALNDQRRLIIDDGSSVQNPAAVPFTDVDGEVIRLGDTVTDVVGALSYGFNAWRLQPISAPTVSRDNPRSPKPDNVGGNVTVASFNVLNYFTTLDANGNLTDTGEEPRGANTAEEFQRQQVKIVAALLALDADIVGLMEIENDRNDEAVQNLVAALNAAAGSGRYAAVQEPDTGGGLFGPDAIKVAMIYQPAAVLPLGKSATTNDPAFDNARPPLAQMFLPRTGGLPITVVVNHFKSKSCGDPAPTDENADQGDGQGCFNADRVEQANALATFLRSMRNPSTLIIGDLNAYGEEDPIDTLESKGHTDLIGTRLAEPDQYSYVFAGQTGYLDHALASALLRCRVTGVDIWHINSDEALFLDYNTEFNPAGYFAPDPYRSSDHDPVVVGIAKTRWHAGNTLTSCR